MFWQRTDHTVIEQAAPVLPKTESAIPAVSQRPPRSGQCVTIAWHGPYSLSDTGAEAFERGVYLVIAKKPDRELVGRSTQSPFREAKQEAKRKELGDDALVWIGEVRHAPSGQAVQKALLKRVARALIFSCQPTENVDSTSGLWIENRWPQNASDGPKFIRSEIADREPEIVTVSAPQGKRWMTAAIVALLLAASVGAIFALRPLDPIRMSRLRSGLEEARTRFAQAQARIEQVTAQLNDAGVKLTTALQRVKLLEVENAGLKSTIANFHPQAVFTGGVGIELQSCWKRADGKPLPVYRIDIRDNAFGVEPAWTDAGAQWPDSFASAMKDFPAAPVSGATPLTQDAFAAVMQPYYDFGTAANRNCRFFVDVTDNTTTKEAWKAGLARVERYFYKRLIAPPTL